MVTVLVLVPWSQVIEEILERCFITCLYPCNFGAAVFSLMDHFQWGEALGHVNCFLKIMAWKSEMVEFPVHVSNISGNTSLRNLKFIRMHLRKSANSCTVVRSCNHRKLSEISRSSPMLIMETSID